MPAVPPTPINRLAGLVLRSPAHRLLSGRLVELRWTGRRTGRRFATPVQFLEHDGELVLLSWADRRWWRNLTGDGAPVAVVLRGRLRHGRARVVPASAEERAGVLRALSGRRAPGRADALARAADAVLVRVALDDAPGGETARA